MRQTQEITWLDQIGIDVKLACTSHASVITVAKVGWRGGRRRTRRVAVLATTVTRSDLLRDDPLEILTKLGQDLLRAAPAPGRGTHGPGAPLGGQQGEDVPLPGLDAETLAARILDSEHEDYLRRVKRGL